MIPTIRRPRLVPRAVASALAQTLREIEVVVVIDGPDPETERALAVVTDHRLRVVALPGNVGLGGAINAGVQAAACDWIALLDDDDEWMPEKLAEQVAVAGRSTRRYPVVTCAVIARSEAGDLVWPLRRPDPDEPISEYLFCQRGLRGGEGVLLPTTLLIPRELLVALPFRTGLPLRNDVDWLLRAVSEYGVRPEFVPGREPLAVWNMHEGRSRIGTSSPWRFALDWIRENRGLVTPRAYAGFLLTSASMTAARGRHWSAFLPLLAEAFRRGKPHLAEVLAHVLIWAVPKPVRNRIVVRQAGRAVRTA